MAWPGYQLGPRWPGPSLPPPPPTSQPATLSHKPAFPDHRQGLLRDPAAGRLLMQAVGVLKPHQEDLPGHPWLPPEPARRRWLLTYRLHAGRAEEDKRPCRGGGGVKTEQRKLVNA